MCTKYLFIVVFQTIALTLGPASASCPAGNVHRLLPHETDCGQFYQCSNGQPILMSCPSGLHFDVNLQVCNWPFAVDCQHGITTNEPTISAPSTTTESTTSNNPTTTNDAITSDKPTTTNKPQTTVNPVNPTTELNSVSGCPKDFSVHVLLTHETDCSLFYQCSNGNKILMTCAPGTLFDVNLQVCNWPDQVKCALSTEATTTEVVTDKPTTSKHTTTEVVTEISTTTELDSHETTTTEFITNKPTTVEVATHNPTTAEPEPTTAAVVTHEPTTTETVTTTENYGTTNEPTTPIDICNGAVGNIPHPEKCDEFYLCTGFMAIQLTCPEDFEFDPELKDCVEIAPGGCTLGHVTTDISITTIQTTNITEINDSATTESLLDVPNIEINGPNVPVFPTELTTISAEDIADEIFQPCPVGVIGNVAHPDRCDAFYLCTGVLEFLLTCPNDYEFDPESQDCVEIAPGGCTLGLEEPNGETTDSPSTEVTNEPNINDTEETNPELTTLAPQYPESDPVVPGLAMPERPESTDEPSLDITEPLDPVNETTLEPEVTNEPYRPCSSGEIGNIPHPDRCDAFYYCLGVTAIELYCPENYEFDEVLKNCVEIAPGGCTLA